MTEPEIYRQVLLDSAPLVAIIDPDDSEHRRCVDMLGRIRPPLLTCWPVVTEAAWLLRRDRTAIRQLLTGPQRGAFTICDLADEDLVQIDRLFAQYSSLSPQLADLAVLHLAQRENLDTVFTLDRRDFTVFRLKGRKRLHLLPTDDE